MKKVRILARKCNNIALKAVSGLDFGSTEESQAPVAIFRSASPPGGRIERVSRRFPRQVTSVFASKIRRGAEKLQQSVAFFTKTHFFVSNISPCKNNDTVVMKVGRG